MKNANPNLAVVAGLALGTLASLCTSTALAQEQEERVLDEVVVTAQKREQTLQEIPMSVTVLGGDTLERQQAFSFEDLTALVPGFSITGSTPGVTRITLRGANTGGVASTVGVYFDEVPFGSSTALANGAIVSGDFDTFDLARVEVLRGPQGTLYGASSLGGVIKYVPNSPSTEAFEGSLKASMEDVDGGGLGYAATGYVNLPMSDTFAVRASAFHREDDGFVDSVGGSPLPSLADPGVNIIDGTMVEEGINSSETSGGRVQALFAPNDEFSINLTAMFQNIDSDDTTQQEADTTTLEPLFPNPVLNRYQDAFNNISYNVYSATIDWDFSDWGSLQSVTSQGEFEQEIRSDLDVASNFTGGPPLSSLVSLLVGSPVGVVQEQITSTDKLAQEFRLVSSNSDKFEWLTGLYYTEEDSLIFQELPALTANTETAAPGIPSTAVVSLDSSYKEIALFANATWYVTDRFELSFGARQSNNDQDVTQNTTGLLVGLPDSSSTTGGSSDESPFTWSISPRYKISDYSSTYLRVATGFRPGGPNILPPGAPDTVPAQYESDSLTNYELGYKVNSVDGKFAMDISAYFIDWEDIQIFAVVENFGLNINGGTAESKGVEFATSFNPTDAWSISFNGAYTDAKLTSPAGAGGQDGDPLDWVPDWSFGLSTDYYWNVGSNSTAYIGATVGYTGERSIGRHPTDADDVRYVDGYTTLNLRAGLDTGTWFAELYGKNLTDELGIQSVSTTNIAWTGNVTMGFSAPRTYGLSAGVRFE